MRSICFSLIRLTLRCFTQDVLSSPVSFTSAGKRVNQIGYHLEITTLVGACTIQGGGDNVPAYITVTVGNHIHQKSQAFTCVGQVTVEEGLWTRMVGYAGDPVVGK